MIGALPRHPPLTRADGSTNHPGANCSQRKVILFSMNASNIWLEITSCIRRVVRSNFQIEQATPGERVKLATAKVPLTDPLVQNYAVWRKSVLWISAICFMILTLVQIIGFQSAAYQLAKGAISMTPEYRNASSAGRTSMLETARQNVENTLHKSNLETVDGLFIFILVSHVIGAILIVISACVWAHLPLSKRLVRYGWLTMFLAPFFLSMLPITAMMDWDKVNTGLMGGAEAKVQLRQGLSVAFALTFFMLVGPKAISLFAGVIRSSITLKTLIPESATPGWAAVLIAPLYSLFLVVITSTVIQAQGNIWLLLGLICLMSAPLVYLLRAKTLLQPHKPDEMTKIVFQIRLTCTILNGLGFIFLIIFVIVVKFFTFWRAIEFFLGLMASLTALTVVASDFLLAVVYKGYDQSKQFQGSTWQQGLESKFEALSTVGLTKFSSSHEAPPPAMVSGMPMLPPVSLSAAPITLAGPATDDGPKTPPPPPPSATA